MEPMEPQYGLATIGDMAKRTGLPVKTIRYYADEGVVAPTARSSGGYRLYDTAAAARLDLVRTLRDLGIDLATIRRIIASECELAEVAAANAEALDAQIRVLRTRRAVLRTIARTAHTGATERDITLMTKLARLSAEERRHIIDEYHDAVFGGLELDPDFEARMRATRVDLPDDPTPEQVDAWVELAELVRDPDYRDRVRTMAEWQQAAVAEGTMQAQYEAGQRAMPLILEHAGKAHAAGTAPDSAEAAAVMAGLAPAVAAAVGTADTPQWRASYADDLDVMTDARSERYWQLVGVINECAPFEPMVPTMQWFIAALRATST
ncbi:DNA-binding transcriptional MerR regulator [Murinocardiopsis flavida]|uniref:DNA-binding transcriptional MerR regulator n=1 Tax=Murinocardiopsis flavida TaxID=645275 RepID=A0A2P8DPD3_9ACTN|nr:MerR family transcriptional regulator [Murinocardiopsis flavida]PSK99053.1 DNA-binding transcriptional MerR regulator [Murinocardiopsis flavida]